MVLLKLLVILPVLAAAGWAFAQFFHGYVYTGAPKSMNWRAPTWAGVVWLLTLAAPIALDWPVTFNDFFLSGGGQILVEFDQLTDPAGGPAPGAVYKRVPSSRGLGGGFEYRDDSGRVMSGWPLVLIGKTKDGETARFEVVKAKDGYIDKTRGVRYKDEDGRVMTEDNFGRLSSSGTGGFFLHVLAGFVCWAIWFVATWLLLEIQWSHALGVSIPIWLGWTIVLVFVRPWIG